MGDIEKQLIICNDRIEIILGQEAQLEANLSRFLTEEREDIRKYEARLTARDKAIEQMSAELEGLRSMLSLHQFSTDYDAARPKPFNY